MKSTFLILIRTLSILLFVVMLCFPTETLSGASTGLLLWFQTVLPTLLPCMILADFLLRIGADRYLTRLFARPLSLIFGLSPSGCYAVLVGFLCGYPMGAKTTASLLAEQRISRQEANYLLSFTNQPSPMFLIGYLCLGLFATTSENMTARQTTSTSLILPVLLGIYGSAVLISFVYRATRKMNRQILAAHADMPITSPCRQTVLSGSEHNKSADPSPLSLLETSMMTSFEVMVKIGGYMMLFSIVEAFVLKLPGGISPWKLLLMGFVEMTTGSRHIAEGIALPWSLALCAGVTAFGGLSGFAQTANVLKGSGLSTSHYFLWKLLQGGLAAILILLWFFLTERYPSL